MPGPAKKEQISDVVAKAMTGTSIPKSLGTKAGNKDWSSSSFYVPKKINLRFNNAINTLKAYGYELDRSDLLSAFMDRFSEAVRKVEDDLSNSQEIDLKEVLSTATGAAAGDLNDVSSLRKQLAETLSLAKELDENNRDLQRSKDQQIAMLLELLPEQTRERLSASLAADKITEAAETVAAGNAADQPATEDQSKSFNELVEQLSKPYPLGGF